MSYTCPGCGTVLRNVQGMGTHGQWSKTCTKEMRFWGRVDKSGGDDACWLWQGPIFKTTQRRLGYGRVEAAGPLAYAHRAAWIFTNGDIPEGKILTHSCDVPRCCNPKHLVLGTAADNMRDMWNKGRGGKNNALTPEQVREIRKLAETMRPVDIAKQYGIHSPIVSGIKYRKKYAWVPD